MELVDEIAEHGVAAVLEDEELMAQLVAWLGGERLSERADEPELRVQAAWEARELFDGLGLFDRLTAQAILALPPDHDERDPELARQLLEEHLQAARDEDDGDEELRTISALLDHGLVDNGDADALLARGEALAEREPGAADAFGIDARSYCVGRYLDARDAGDEDGAESWLARATGYERAGEDDLSALASLAEELDIAQRWPEAAAVYRRLVEAASLDDAPVQELAIREGELWLMTGDAAAAATALDEALPHIEARYLDALRDEDIADASDALVRAVGCLALAQGYEAGWSAVCRTLDRTRGLRLRMQAALRGTADGARLLELERGVQAALRGAPGAGAPVELLERYRRLRPRDVAALQSPDGDELARALEPGEAVAFVAHHFTGSIVAVAWRGGVDGFVNADVATADWLLALSDDENGPGWIAMLADPAAATPGAGLAKLLEAADDAVGAPLLALLEEHGVRRLTVLAQGILPVVPWWALPSLADLEVLAADSAAGLLRDRAAAEPPAPRTALIVSDPTLDLPVTAAACDGLRTTLAAFDPLPLADRAATEPAVVAALPGRTILHVGGHGRSDVAYSALELQPDPPLAQDPFPPWVDEVETWRSPEDDDGELWTHRWADLPRHGRLHERRWEASGRLDRWLEHAGGTIAATYRDGRCVRVGELWSAADLLIGDALRDCRLAVLTACESAVSGRGEDSRALGLPAGLAFAGVGSVVGSLWPVDEAFAVLWSAHFYDELAAAGATVDLAALVHATAAHMRAMSRDEAATRLRSLAATSANPIARFMLEADAARLGDPPFAEPHHWAAFYLTGRPTLTLEEAHP